MGVQRDGAGANPEGRKVAVCERVPVVAEKSVGRRRSKGRDAVKQSKASSVEERRGGVGSADPATPRRELELLQVSKVTSSAEERAGGGGGGGGRAGRQEEAARPVKSIYTGFESSKVIKMEQTSQPRSVHTPHLHVCIYVHVCLYTGACHTCTNPAVSGSEKYGTNACESIDL